MSSLTRLSATAIRAIAFVAVAVVVVGAGYYYFFGDRSTKKVTAYFASGVGVYNGTPVEILGIKVGEVTKVTPDGGSVKIELEYTSKYKLPADASAVIVANSLVSDRYIQLTPVYPGTGPVLAGGASIPLNRTSSPAELDDIYAALNKLSVSLGPQGANKNGALSTLIDVAAANLKGNGAALGNSIDALSAAASTLADSKGDLFATVQHLQAFTKTLSDSDAQVRHFESQLAQAAGELADERGDLGQALNMLSTALDEVAGFVRDNASKIHTDVGGLKTLAGILAKEQAALNETLAVAPVALSNVVHAYQSSPDAAPGTLGTRSNLASLTNIQGQVCGVLNSLGELTGNLLGSLTQPILAACTKVAGGDLSALPVITNLTNLLGGGLPGVPG